MKTVQQILLMMIVLVATTAQARYFSPREGIFLSADRAGMVDGPNLYRYVRNQPTQLTDPTGMYATFGSRMDIPPGHREWQSVPNQHSDTGHLRLREVAEEAFDIAEGWLMRPGVGSILRKECRIDPGGGAVARALDAMEYGSTRQTMLFFFNQKTAIETGAGGASADLGSRPFKIAFGPSFQHRGQLYVGGPTTVPVQQLAVTFVHELLHHYLQYGHAGDFTEANDPIYRASKEIAKSAGYNPW